jgi:hypothetical protein
VRKTHSHEVVTLDVGPFMAHETQCFCAHCPDQPISRSEDLNRLVPPKARFGYEIMVYVGIGVFQRHRTAREIVAELAERNVSISLSEIHELAEGLILYLAEAHRESRDRLQAFLKQQGGYLLHLDSTCDGGSVHLMSLLDELSEFVLINAKITSEKTDEIVPILQQAKATYGQPLAIVSDMSKAILAAVAQVFDGSSHFICHFHFLRDIGKDLLETAYSRIRNRLRAHGISSLLHRRARD